MSKSHRLQVMMEDDEYAALESAAAADGMTVSEWVRVAIRDARRRRAEGSPDQKLRAIADAAQHEYPTADIDQMLAEIEAGYR